jgi:glycosyltransferase involved in cell wall biosynthesis
MNLYYFTFCYPFGDGEQWKANELNVLVRHFEAITVVPFFYGGNFDKPKPLPTGVKLSGPLFKEIGLPGKKSDLFRIIFNRNGILFIREFFARRVYKTRNHLQSWMGSTLNIIRLLKHPVIKDILAAADKRTVLYFYWGKGSSDIIPFIDTEKFNKVFVRMHRFDLFEFVNNNYIPYRRPLMKRISIAAPVSYAGKDHLTELYPDMASKIKVFRIGTLGNGKRSKPSGDNCLRVVSCSALSPVKRVETMIKSLQFIDFPISWHHLGDGILSEELTTLAKDLGVDNRFFFEGKLDSERIMDYYTDHTFDLFVNTSENEGVPVSIMEAFAAGIPAMATDVGGTRELVDEHVGKLLTAEITPAQLAENLAAFYRLSSENKLFLRDNAFKRYSQNWNANMISEDLSKFLLS